MKRAESIDLLRGLIIILMALDHASALVGRVHFTEIWGVNFAPYPSAAWWFTRFVSHLCAPGFFLLMGMSIYLFAEKRSRLSWRDREINGYFMKRGVVILLIMLFLELPAWVLGNSFSQVQSDTPFPGVYAGGFLLPTTVLYGLGMCMITGGFLWRLTGWQLVGITVLSFGLSGWYINQLVPTEAFHPAEVLLMVPGFSSGAMSIYPVVPWVGVTAFGIFLGQLLHREREDFYRLALQAGVVFLLAFLGLRTMEWGNFHRNEYNDLLTFFTLIKYPPSVTFILVTCGVNLILLFLFSKISGSAWLKPVLVFGQTAMFFYILHLYFYALTGAFFPKGSSMGVMYLLWVGGLVLLYFLCRRFLVFKKSKPPNSLWRMI